MLTNTKQKHDNNKKQCLKMYQEIFVLLKNSSFVILFLIILISVLDFMLAHQVKIKWKWEMIDWNNWNIISFYTF